MKVCIAEKPSVAREIAFILGAKSRQDGYYEGNGYCVTWTFGHLCTLKEPDDYQAHWKKWHLNTLPILPERFDVKLKTNKGVKKQFGIIKKLFKKAEVVINCGDAGQEGELIQRWVLQMANYRGRVQRLWISSLTPEAIRDGFQNLKDARQFDNLYYAGRSRAIGDWLLGMNATRLYTLKYGGYKQLLSIGRVQTPTLAMLVERHHEIENFVPTTYWELQTLYREVTFNCELGKFMKKEDGEAILNQIEGKPFVILSFTKKKGREYPPRLFDLTSLQVHCNKRFAFSAEQTLQIVQKLYEQKVVTYPRVDTTYLPTDVYPKVPGILSKMTQYSQFTQVLLGKQIRKSGKVFNDSKVTDHHAIIPTGVEKSLPVNDQKVYDAIARRFIAAFYPDCIVSNTTVIGEVDGIKFKATGKEILEEGWRILFPKPPPKTIPNNKKPEDKKQSETILPVFKKGESGPHLPTLVEKQTQPPKVYTEGTLLRAMETAGKKVDDEALRELMKANGIGRPSTRANIIETLFKRRYIQRRKKQIIPTEMGIQLIATIQNELLKSAELTGQWEKQLRDIESGAYAEDQFINDMKTMVTGLIEEVKQAKALPRIVSSVGKQPATSSKKRTSNRQHKSREITQTRHANLTELTCPKCRKGKLLKGKTAYGCSQWKVGCSFRLPFEFKQKKLPEAQLRRLMAKGSTIQLKGFQEEGKKLSGKLIFNKDFTLSLQKKETTQASNQLRPNQPTANSQKTNTPTPNQPRANELPATPPTPNSQFANTPTANTPTANTPTANTPTCPKCGLGKVIKGKTAYGCSLWKTGCTFRFPFEEVRKAAAGKALTRELVWEILRGKK